MLYETSNYMAQDSMGMGFVPMILAGDPPPLSPPGVYLIGTGDPKPPYLIGPGG
jgi:hypothetical protein